MKKNQIIQKAAEGIATKTTEILSNTKKTILENIALAAQDVLKEEQETKVSNKPQKSLEKLSKAESVKIANSIPHDDVKLAPELITKFLETRRRPKNSSDIKPSPVANAVISKSDDKGLKI